MIHHYSSWHRLKKRMAWILRYRDNLLRACRKRKEKEAIKYVTKKPTPITTEEMQCAETEILKHVQKTSSFTKDPSHVSKLDPTKIRARSAGVDCFGPFMIKRGRSQVKWYGVLYTCLAVRAIHIEVLHSMDTDSFVNSLRRFIARRGKPEIIRSDNGTNFVAGNKEIPEAISQWNDQKIHEFLLQRQVKWVFNPPSASHHGGIWERCIRTVRKVLNALLKEHILDDEGLSTLLCEVESIVDSRPITKTSNDPADLEPLTPNHLLLLRSELNPPPGIFSSDDMYSRRKWKQVQYLADVFWSRWIKEYLPKLQERQKWTRPSRNFAIDDVVLIVDDRLPRCSWPLGRVTDVHRNSQDGYVRSVTVQTKNSVFNRPIKTSVVNCSMDVFPGNTLAEYRVQLPQSIKLVDEWEVAIMEIQYPHTWNNVHTESKWNRFYIKKGVAVEGYFLPPGHYPSIESIIVTMNDLIQKSIYKNEAWFSFEKLSRKITVHLQNNVEAFFSDVGILLGFGNGTLYSKTTTAEREVDLDHGFHNRYVYCDIVESQWVGNAQVPLLRIVPVEGEDGQRVSKTFMSPQYLPVSRKEFESIEVNIRRDSGEIVPFETGRLLVTLHLRRASPYFH
ncbi:hypothetical protein QZH41_002885 [Actinostola sp. cb2023]|nr:hypothetical protein QZH41_002885 [Actinostola sp. cb2023]